MNVSDYRKSKVGGIIAWILIIGIVGAIAYYINGHPKLLRISSLTAPVIAKPRPSPTPTPEVDPEPEPTPEPTATPTPIPTPTPTPSSQTNELFAAEVTRQKEGLGASGNDEKGESVLLRVKLINKTAEAYESLKGAVYTLAESNYNPDNVRVIGKTVYTFSLSPIGCNEKITDQANTVNNDEKDPNAARYGFKYIGWLVQLTDKAGKVVYEKASTPEVLKQSEQISQTPVGDTYTIRKQ